MKSVFKKRGVIIGLVVVVVIIIAVIGVVTARNNANSTEYKVTTVKKDSPLLLKGQIAADNTVDVTAPSAGTSTLESINVQDGQHVTQNQTLMTFHDSSAENQVYEAQQSLAKANLAVSQDQANLSQAQSQSTAEGGAAAVRQAQNQLSQDQLAVSQAQQQINNLQSKVTTTVRASISGTVSLNYNTTSATGLPSMQIISDGQIINGTVSEYDYSKIQAQDAVKVLPISSDDKLDGTIVSIATTPQNSGVSGQISTLGSTGAAASSSTVSNYKFTVRINRKLINGFNVQIKVPQDTIRLSDSAVVKTGNKYYVYRVIKNKAVKTQVRVHQDNGIYFLDSGLSVKDKIVANPDKALKSGQEVSASAN
ncbi:hypothetical protein FC83_GL001261 [Agrilactobacillus composti DSM 18527 = JCM 14202]|uniref:Uncharacterized protein n=1 Tax=Agrilactobacillus composti DSM 18527 = JCM 14202 TaxID=1423734 RepID=X0QNP2_9LACO|nr:hypothetical protein [Agrilactobacillus composti]KRM35134.1 hypothetical protein FC83_GL001261 [Agrilactobacillus composti DSM 18527 = JCM 14202]GAF40240.1 periplasmic component of efflux system [Agrilactobacillus composti DSM 18527 = JCM 14202]